MQSDRDEPITSRMKLAHWRRDSGCCIAAICITDCIVLMSADSQEALAALIFSRASLSGSLVAFSLLPFLPLAQ
jgi:hypothetical protein